MDLYFATSNRHKVDEASQILGFRIKQINLEIDEIQALRVHEVAVEKAKAAYSMLHKPVIVEDTGLYINALGGFPGALVRWLVDAAGTESLCRLADASSDRSAYAETCVCYADDKGTAVFSGRVDGNVTEKPRGKNNFGWDTVFMPKGFSKTFGEMTAKEKNKISHRMLAFTAFKKHIEQLHGNI